MTDRQDTRGDWFAVDRGVFDHPTLAGPFDKRSAWLWLIAAAAWKRHRVRTRGGVIDLARGDVLVGRDHLAAEWGWTPKRVRTFLSELQREGMLKLGQRTGQYATVATICNYDRFQSVSHSNGPAGGPAKGHRGANEGPHRTKETTGTIEGAASPVSMDAVNQAVQDFNRAAEEFGFSRCTTLTPQRSTLLARRLREIGDGDLERGRLRFQEALSAIPHWSFLAGREKPRPGKGPFRLDLGRLLSTSGGLDDVLARLCDLYDERGPAARNPAAANAPDLLTAIWGDAQAEELDAQRARFNGEAADAFH